MKLSVSLPESDVEYLDAYVQDQHLGSRSAAVQKAVRLLRASELGAAYEDVDRVGGRRRPSPLGRGGR